MTLSILFLFIVLLGATLVCAGVVKGALTKSPFKSRKRTQADFDKARMLAREILRRVHP